MSAEKIRVAVLMGGDSSERDVSLVSGTAVLEALRAMGHEAWPLDPALPVEMQEKDPVPVIGEAPPGAIEPLPPRKAFEWLVSARLLEADLVFVALHGGAGEDGTVQALLETARKPYTGTGVMGSALAMNKDRSKALFSEAGVQTAPYLLTRGVGEIEIQRVREAIESAMGFPVVIKPNDQGSSVGFSFVPDPSGLPGALEAASDYGDFVLVERYIPGREITGAVLDGAALPLVEIIPESGFYDYRSKYTKGTSSYEVPAGLDRTLTERIKREAVMACNALGCRDYARVDFRLSEDGEPFCLEVNTLPGMTELSLVPMAAAEAGIPFGELVERICMSALAGSGRR